MKSAMPSYFRELLAEQTPPCISIYMPTARGWPPAAENSRRLREAIDKAKAQIGGSLDAQELKPLLDPVSSLLDDRSFWANAGDGLAIFASASTFQTVRLPAPPRFEVEVADSFHLKPLIRAQQFAGEVQILCLNQRNVRLLEGNQNGLRQVELNPNVPTSLAKALRKPITEVEWQGGTGPGRQEGGGPESDRVSATTNDLDHFFRVLDERIWTYHSRSSGLPLMLCAVQEYHPRFHAISKNPNLMEEGIRLNPDAISLDRIRSEAWGILEPSYQRELNTVMEAYGQARAHERGSEDLAQVAQAAAFARVATLLVDADRRVGGRLDPASGRVEYGDVSRAEFDDLLDDIAERVIKTGGQVLVMPHEQMPSNTGVAAIYRF